MTRQMITTEQLTGEEFELFRSWIHEHSGIFLEDSKTEPLRISLAARAALYDVEDYGDYYRLISRDEEEFKALMNLVTINETSFFRFPAQFDVLRDTVIPEILARQVSRSGVLRLWSAGCSTGEEPYSLAITALDSILPATARTAEILGTDVSTDALTVARRAIYPARAFANLPAETVRRWFEPAEEGFQPIDEVKEACRFAFHNMVKDGQSGPFAGPWDVIFCRNVTIYFRNESTKRVVDRFFDALNPGGYLFIGHSETLAAVTDRFEAIEFGGVFVYRKPDNRRTFALGSSRTTTTRQARTRQTRDSSSAGLSRNPSARSRVQPSREVDADALSAKAPSAELLTRAHVLLESAQAQQALEIADSVLACEPGNLDARLVAAYAHADLGHREDAAAQATASLELDPLAAPARYVLGVIKREQGDLDGALTEFRRTLYADKDFVPAHFAVASIQRQRGELSDAAREYEKTIRALNASPEGSWTAFLGGFRPDLLTRTCELGLIECAKAGAGR